MVTLISLRVCIVETICKNLIKCQANWAFRIGVGSEGGCDVGFKWDSSGATPLPYTRRYL